MEVQLHELTSVPNGAVLFHILTTDVKQQGRRKKQFWAVLQRCTNFPKLLKPHQNFRRPKGDMKQVQRQDPQILGDAA